MLHTTAAVYVGKSLELPAQVELDLDDLLPILGDLMPVSFTGKFVNLGDTDGETIRVAKTIEILFAGTVMRYGVIIDRETLQFRVINTSERGLSQQKGFSKSCIVTTLITLERVVAYAETWPGRRCRKLLPEGQGQTATYCGHLNQGDTHLPSLLIKINRERLTTQLRYHNCQDQVEMPAIT